jgi:stage III sporulation protein AD
MGIAQIVGVGIVAAALAVTVRTERADIGMLLGVCGSLLLFFMVLPQLTAAIQIFRDLADGIPVDSGYISIILKIVGVAYIAEFGAQVCADAGENAIASKIELSGKILVMLLSAPIVLGIMQMIGSVLP